MNLVLSKYCDLKVKIGKVLELVIHALVQLITKQTDLLQQIPMLKNSIILFSIVLFTSSCVEVNKKFIKTYQISWEAIHEYNYTKSKEIIWNCNQELITMKKWRYKSKEKEKEMRLKPQSKIDSIPINIKKLDRQIRKNKRTYAPNSTISHLRFVGILELDTILILETNTGYYKNTEFKVNKKIAKMLDLQSWLNPVYKKKDLMSHKIKRSLRKQLKNELKGTVWEPQK